ncbi:MAG: type IV-A pilus assembly ATPase PilB [bacterium]
MEIAKAAPRLFGIVKQLVDEGILSSDEALEAQANAKAEGTRLTSYLLNEEIVSSKIITQLLSSEYGIPVLAVDAIDPDMMPTEHVDEGLVEKYHALPVFKRGSHLFIAISDPMNLAAVDEFKFKSGLTTEPVLVEEPLLQSFIEKSLEAADSGWSELADDEDLDNIEIAEGAEANTPDATAEIDDTPVVRFVNKMLLDAIKKGASDIHVEPFEHSFRIRFRLDGILSEVASPPLNLASKIIARIKVMSRMDISERRIPQDGRIKLQMSKNRAIDFRVNTCPTLFGEKIVLRILDPSSAQIGIDALGYTEQQKQLYLDALAKPHGMILVTGPTGSGKTVSLYTGLNILNTVDRNISTAEDPAEINVPGINQVNVNPKVGLTFAEALRAFLRQDPDIIMVGEIRDLETAEIAIKAAQTGHLVLSTLHTNDAPQTLTRLANMGVPAFNIASSVSLIIAQRLARKLCPHCKARDELPDETLLSEGFKESELSKIRLFRPVGCDKCTDGYKGRVGIFQVMPVSEEMGRIIMAGGNSLQLADQAEKEGIPDLRRSGLLKVREGVTSLAEVNRVTKD